MKIMVLAPRRLRLKSESGRKIEVTGVYAGTGTRMVGGRLYLTVLIRDVRDAATRVLLTDHLWFNRGRIWRKAGLLPGDRIAFLARSIEYRTGYWGTNIIRRLEHPPRVEYKLTPPDRLQVLHRRINRSAA